MPTLVFHGRKADLIARLKQLGPILSGKAPDPGDIATDLLMPMGVALLGKIQDDYVKKSEGGTGEIGGRWAPLAASTLAMRRKGPTGAKAVAKLKRAARQVPAERQRLIQTHYNRLLELYRGGEGTPGAAARMHARHLLRLMTPYMAAGRVKRLERELTQQQQPKQQRRLALAGAFSLILRDTGRLLNGLSPQLNSPDRQLIVTPGAISIGSNVDYLKYHQSSLPRRMKADGTPRLPRRQVLPDDQTPIPESWRQEMSAAFADGLRSEGFWRKFLGQNVRIG